MPETVVLTTQSAVHEVNIQDFAWPYRYRRHSINFGLATNIARPTDEYRVPIIHRPGNDMKVTDTVQHESITLKPDKATRLVRIFQELSSNQHSTDCHGLLFALEEWSEDDVVLNHRILSGDMPIASGKPYQVLINAGTNDEPDWIFTHSAVGTDEGRLLGLTGPGMPLGTMDRETTLRIHSLGSTPFLAEASISEDGQYRVSRF